MDKVMHLSEYNSPEGGKGEREGGREGGRERGVCV